MGNIVGEKFDSYVSGQIAVRQALQSQGFLEGNTRDYRFTQLLNSQNAWLKLSSSVRVQNTPAGKKRLTDIGLNNADNFTRFFIVKICL